MQQPVTNGSSSFSYLGHGAQFKTFDMHNDRVLKIPLTEAETYQVARRRHNIIHGTLEELATIEMRTTTFMNSKSRVPAMIQHKFTNPEPFLKLLGNPQIEAVGDLLPEDTNEKRWGGARFVYSQDHVSMAHVMLQSIAQLPRLGAGDIARLKRYIEEYVAYIYDIWDYGYSDYVFKLGDTGVDKAGNLICVDLGEWTSDLEFMKRAIGEKWWQDNVNHQKHDFPKLPKVLESFYLETLGGALTIDSLMQHWRSKHVCESCGDARNTLAAFVSTQVAEIDYIDRL